MRSRVQTKGLRAELGHQASGQLSPILGGVEDPQAFKRLRGQVPRVLLVTGHFSSSPVNPDLWREP